MKTSQRIAVALAVLSVSAFGQTFKVESVATPAGASSLQANWSVTPAGDPLLSWVEIGKNDSASLRYAVRHGNAWSTAQTIASGRHFFRHPAELPEVLALAGGTFMAHWIEQPEGSDDAEFVYVSASKDGVHWTAPAMANKDRSPFQHGLASMIDSGNGEASILWLQALKGEDNPAQLMRTVVNADGHAIKEETLDSDVCTCCPTSVVKTGKGLLVAYRGHNAQDIRDIYLIRFENGKWLPSKNVYADKWKIDACPTNAAVAAAKGDNVAIAWYTAAGDKPRVEAAFSADGGATFGKPVVVNTAQAYGYASTVLDDDGSAIVSWLEQGGGAGRVMARRVSANGVAGPVTQVAQGSRMDLGYPRLLHAGSDTWIAWGNTKVQTARLAK
jgi:hypothetical protein